MQKTQGRRPLWAAMATAVTATLALSACGVTGSEASGSASSASAGPISGLQVMVPNTPGGGYDVTARTAARVMDEAKLTESTEVFNLAGAGGTVGLARTVNEKGNADLMMLMGLGVVGASYTNEVDATLANTTPIARLIEEAGAVFVPRNSPYQTITDLVTAWKADPAHFPVGGGSSPGGPDHLLPMQLADAVGIDPKQVNFVSYDGGGELLPALLGGQISFATSGYTEFIDQLGSGDVRALATTGAQRVPVVDAPTLTESGIDLEFTNWRGLVAPPGLSAEQTQRLVGLVERMHDTDQWAQAIKDNGWTDALLTGEDFATFLKQQDERVRTTLTDLGLA